LGVLAGCSDHSETVFYPLNVSFESVVSESVETATSTSIAVRLNAESEQVVEATYTVTDLSATGHDACGTRDYTLASGSLRFEPGQTVGLLELRQLDDDVYELDEVLTIELTSATGAVLGELTTHEHTILDDDRQLLVDVKADFGAIGDGATDDTAAIQAAIDRASLSSAAVVFWPSGVYRVSSLELYPAINYFGYGATLLQAPGQPGDAQLLTLSYAGDDDSPLTLVQGLTLDGNREAQGPYDDWEFQESELLNAAGAPNRSGRLRVVAEDVTFKDTGGSGLLLGTNTDAVLCQIVGDDVFTDVFKLAGGSSRLSARHVVGDGTVGTTGIAIAPQQPGYQDSQTVEVFLEQVDLATGDLEIDIRDGSSLVASTVTMSDSPFFLRAVRSEVVISDSTLFIGAPGLRYNRIVAPNSVTLRNSDLYLTERVERSVTQAEQDQTLTLLNVTWNDVNYVFDEGETGGSVEKLTDQELLVEGCRFHLADDVDVEDTTYVAGSVDSQDATNRIEIVDGVVDTGYSAVFAPSCTSCSMSP
jgi:hypothetical protein